MQLDQQKKEMAKQLEEQRKLFEHERRVILIATL